MKKKLTPAKRTRCPTPTTEVVVLPKATLPSKALVKSFAEVIGLIQQARQRAFQTVNTALIDLYWQVGEYITRRIESDGWGKSTISELAAFIRRTQVGARGFSAQNLWRMRQFYETHAGQPKLSALLRELPWTHNLSILGRCKRPEEREFYLRLAAQEKWSSRELERQLAGALFERTVLSPPKVAAVLRQLHLQAENVFKDTYLLDFLDLPEVHDESDLQRGLVAEYQTRLPDKRLLQAKLHEFYQLQLLHTHK